MKTFHGKILTALILTLVNFYSFSASANQPIIINNDRNDLSSVFQVQTSNGIMTVQNLIEAYEQQQNILNQAPDATHLALELALALSDQAFRMPRSALIENTRFSNAVHSLSQTIAALESVLGLPQDSVYAATPVLGKCCKSTTTGGSTVYSCVDEARQKCIIVNGECAAGSTECANTSSLLVVDHE